MAKFKPGQSGNPKGRPKGRTSAKGSLKREFAAFLASEWPLVKQDWQQLEPTARVSFFERLLPYALPQVQGEKTAGKLAVKELETR